MTDQARKLFENKFWGQYYAAKYGASQLSTKGSITPGIIDTPSRSKMPENTRNQFYDTVAHKLPVKRVGLAEDVARGVLYLIQNQFVTGTVLHVDGGHILT